jgi:hypothetical protein
MDLSLEARAALPDALRVLLDQYPRDRWESDPNFHGLVSFWLGMHLQFRDTLATLRRDAEALLGQRADPRDWALRTSRLGGGFLHHLHGHHGIEDGHYFPLLAQRDARLLRGFDILDLDHKALDGHLDRFAQEANAALRAREEESRLRDEAGRFHAGLLRLERFLDRHLTDEEDLIVPVILRDGETGLGH